MESLKEYMLLFRMAPSQQAPAADEITQMQNQWKKFIGNIASQAKLVNTSRLAFEGSLIQSNGEVTNQILIENNQTLSGNMIVKASNLTEAENLAKHCPVLFASGSVEVRSLIPMDV